MRRILILLTIALGFAGTTAAEESLSFKEAILKAIESNPKIRAAENRVRAAEATEDQARAFRMPELKLAEMFSYTDNPAEVFAFTLNQRRFDMNGFFQSDPNTPDALDTWLTRLDITQPVYTGGKLSHRNRQAKLMAEAAQLDWRQSVEQVVFDTAQAYANAIKAREYAAVIRKARDTTARHVKLAESYAKEGMIVRADLLKAQVYLSKMEQELVTAESNAELARAALNFSMGIDQNLHFGLSDIPEVPAIKGPASQWIENAPDLRWDINARRMELEAGKLEEKVATASLKPEIGIVGHYDLYDDTVFGSNGHSGSLMAAASIKLFHGGAERAEAAAARYNAKAGAQQIKQFEEGIRLQARQAWSQVQTAEKRHETATKSLDAAREALRVREERFRQGLDKMIDLLDAETSLEGAEVRELVSRFDLILANFSLHLQSGHSLAEALNISLPKEID